MSYGQAWEGWTKEVLMRHGLWLVMGRVYVFFNDKLKLFRR